MNEDDIKRAELDKILKLMNDTVVSTMTSKLRIMTVDLINELNDRFRNLEDLSVFRLLIAFDDIFTSFKHIHKYVATMHEVIELLTNEMEIK